MASNKKQTSKAVATKASQRHRPNKCGVYKYTEDPDFEVLLFGYAVDGGEVHVVDLALGEKIPADIAASLTDENVLKFAFNANFERVCLSRHLGMPTGEYLDPSSWRCTMVWAAYMGLPLSLQGVGAVLNLDKQKLTEGKELIKRKNYAIRYFNSDLKEVTENA